MRKNSPTRVLQSVGTMNHGGIENFIMNVYRKIDRSKIQFDFMYRADEECAFDVEIRSLGGHIFNFQSPDKHFITAWNFYNHFFRNHPEYQIVHEHRSTCAGFLGCLRAAKRNDVPVRIVHAHNSHPMCRRGLIGNFAEQVTHNSNKPRIMKIATEGFACSDLAAQWLFPKNIIDAKRVSIIQNGIDVERFKFSTTAREATRKEYGIPSNAFLVGHIGRFVDAKNHLYLFKIFKLLLKQRPDSYLCLVGTGNLECTLRSFAKELGLESRIIFAGSHADVTPFYSAMDVFCMPSKYEGLPLVTIEAQANGLPLVLSDNVSQNADLTGLVSYLPITKDASLWAEELLSKKRNFSQFDLAVKAIKKAGFDSTGVANSLQQFYLSSLEENR